MAWAKKGLANLGPNFRQLSTLKKQHVSSRIFGEKKCFIPKRWRDYPIWRYCYAILRVPKYSPSINKTLYCSLAIPYVLHLPFHCFAIRYCPHIIGHNGPTLSYGKDSFLCRITARGVPLSALRPYLHRQFCKGGHVAPEEHKFIFIAQQCKLRS